MSNKDDRHSELLAETFHGDWTGGPAGDFARRAAQHARRHRGRRQALLFAGAATGLAAAIMFSVHRPVPAALARATQDPAPAYEVISDDDLIAGVRDRPVLVLPQENGTKKIVLLADKTDS
jgi:hypothetical protein